MWKAKMLFLLFVVHVLVFVLLIFPVESVVPLDTVEMLSLPDGDKSVSASEVAERYGEEFYPAPGGVIHFRSTRETIWLRIPLSSMKERARTFGEIHPLLALRKGYVLRVEAFIPVGPGKSLRVVQGMETESVRRNLPTRYLIFHLPYLDGDEYCYMNVRAIFPVAFDLMLCEEDWLYGLLVDRLTAYMTFYGFMLAMVLTGFLFYFTTGDGEFPLVALRQAATLIFLFSFNGYFRFYFNLSLFAVRVLVWGALAGYCAISVLFDIRLLQKNGVSPHRRFVLLQGALLAAMSLFALYGDLIPAVAALAVFLAAEAVFCLATGAPRLLRRDRETVLYILSRLAFILGMTALAADVLLPLTTSLLEYCMMTLLLLDPLLLNYVLLPRAHLRIESIETGKAESAEGTLSENSDRNDKITGLCSREHFLSVLERHVRTAHQNKKDLAFIMAEIDDYENCHAAWGRGEEGKLLFLLGTVVQRNLRESDIAARYDEAQVCIVLPGGTLPTSILVAERIRKSFERQTVASGVDATEETENGPNNRLTVSLGLSFLKPDDMPLPLIRRAADALARAAACGGNRTEFEVID